MKIFKKLLTVLMACMLCLGVFTACGGDKDPENAYVICVVDESGNAIEGVSVGICTADGLNCYGPYTTDAKGKAVIEKPQGSYKFNLIDTHYTVVTSEADCVYESYGAYTVVLRAK